MVKKWECTQCGSIVSKGIIKSFQGPPQQCETCGNDEFDDPYITGGIHRTIDRFSSG
ncbi:MAG: hypothetical protein ABEH65_02655 [Halobacteriales archaeon]